MKKVVLLPPMNPRYKNKVYSVEIDGEEKKKVIGIERAMKLSKYYKYSNYESKVTLKNITSGQVIYSF